MSRPRDGNTRLSSHSSTRNWFRKWRSTGYPFIGAAIEGEQFDERALAVTDGNLDTMYAGDGNVQQSRSYARLASRGEAAETTLW